MEDVKIVVSKSKYLSLLEDSRMLNCLYNAGVDNWEGYEYACEAYNECADSDCDYDMSEDAERS